MGRTPALLLSLLLFAPTAWAGSLLLPGTETIPRTRDLSSLRDDFRWLEDGKAPKVEAWAARRDALARIELGARPGRAKLRARLEELMAGGSVSDPVWRGGRLFYLKRTGRQNQPVLYVLDSMDTPATPIIDPNTMSGGKSAAIDWFYPSPDGLMVAYGVSQRGSEESVLRVLEVNSAQDLPDRIDRTRYASLAWLPDRTGFYYTRYPAPGTVPKDELLFHRHVFFHRIGDGPSRDALVFGMEIDKADWPQVELSHDGRYLLITVYKGRSRTDLYLKDLKGKKGFVALVKGRQALYEARMEGKLLYIRTNEDAPRYRLMSVKLKKPERRRWREIVEQGAFIIADFVVTRENLVLSVLERASSRLRLHDLKGKPLREIPIPPNGTVRSFDGNSRSGELFIQHESFFRPPTLYRYQVSRSSLSVVDASGLAVDFSDYRVRQATYRSADGTLVTMSLIHNKWIKRDGNIPTLLTGFGGFSKSMTPRYSPHLIPWLERGGLYALPNLRGGGEYGEVWHQAGMLGYKQNVFDDFLAAARWLVKGEYTRPERLAIAGGGNGGLLVGAAMTQAPSLFQAAICAVPLLDMARYHLFRLGRLWVPEYGSVEDPEQARWLLAYSPYHRVRRGGRYPAVMFLTGELDNWVDPMHARKMAARLLRDSGSGHPVLLRRQVDAGNGEGRSLDLKIDEWVDRYSFLFWQLGMEISEPEGEEKPPKADKKVISKKKEEAPTKEEESKSKKKLEGGLFDMLGDSPSPTGKKD